MRLIKQFLKHGNHLTISLDGWTSSTTTTRKEYLIKLKNYNIEKQTDNAKYWNNNSNEEDYESDNLIDPKSYPKNDRIRKERNPTHKENEENLVGPIKLRKFM
ncbi:hypothetical protein Glove_54g146 [Diversispora epigaea]|uniref:DUF659 domain-containing protein n=1 Tax=Diversispora epigaea TaxID=1348612 RepID=A0A397JCT2_9GLOM|nr:hypothetical protein Glove_54g146 [Diversispora epigaea]